MQTPKKASAGFHIAAMTIKAQKVNTAKVCLKKGQNVLWSLGIVYLLEQRLDG